MASVVKLGVGKQPPRAIDFFDHRGRRQRLRLGKVTHDVATEFKRRIEKLVNSKRLNQSLDAETVTWLNGICMELRKRLAQFGLCDLPDLAPAIPTLETLLHNYIAAKRIELKLSSLKRLENTFQRMKSYFVGKNPIDHITPAMAKDWRTQMLSDGLSEASIRTNARNAKSVFRDAVERRYIDENPFSGLISTSVAADRAKFVTEAETELILNACPDNHWKCLIGLARYAGLRVPSESHLVTWKNVDWNRSRLTVFALKTSTTRTVPISPRLLVILTSAYQETPDLSGAIVPLSPHNRHRQFTKIIKAAGLSRWPDLFQTLRRSCETQLAMSVPQHAVSAWIGHSQLVSARHYLQVTDELFERVTGNNPVTCKQNGAAESAAVKPGIASHGEENGEMCQLAATIQDTKTPGDCRVFPSDAIACEVVRGGVEPPTHGFSVRCSTN